MQIRTIRLLLLATSLAFGAVIFSMVHYKNYFYSAQTFDMKVAFERENVTAVLVLGSGCAGYAAAVYGGRGNVKTVVLAGNQLGGQLNGTSHVDNVLGLYHELGPDIMQKYKKQAEEMGAEIINDTAVSIDTSQWPYEVTTEDGKKIYALTIVVATGASPLTLGVPGEQEYWGKGVTTCARCDAPFHAGNDVVVIGGGDSAAEEALQLSAHAKTITIAVRKDTMRASPNMQDRLKEIPSISIMYNTEVKSISGDNDKVTNVQLYNNKTGETEVKSVSGVFLAIGHTPNSAILKDKVEMDKSGYIIMQGRTQQTSVPGIFAAGDVEDYVYRQAGVASGRGISAALDALTFLQNNGFTPDIAKQLKSRYFKAEALRVSSVIKVNTVQEFEEIRKTKRIFVLDFYTNFCPSCMQMMPALEAVAYKYADRVTFCKVDASAVLQLAEMYHVASVPAILVFKDGALVGRYNQAMSKKQLQEFVERFV